MGSFREHMLFGAAFSLLAYTVLRGSLQFSVAAAATSIAFILLAAIFPDIDHQGSWAHTLVKHFLILAAITAVSSIAYPYPWAMLAAAVSTGTGVALLFSAVKPKHRGVTHSVRGAVVFAAAVAGAMHLWFDTVIPGVFAFVSYLSHMVLDGTVFKIRR